MRKNKVFLKKLKKFTQLRLKTIDDGILRAGPDFVRMGISRSCNFNCLMCWNYSPLLKKSKSSYWKRFKLDKNIVLKVINEAEKMGCRGILFSGAGEPFTHPNMMEFLKIAKRKGFRVRLQTNLSLVKDPLSLAKLKIDVVAVNLCAATPETYVKIHSNQTKKDFNKILSRMKILIDKADPDMEVRMTNIITKENYKEIFKMVYLSYEMGASLHLELADYSLIGGVGKIAINNKQKQQIIKELNSLDKKYKKYQKSNINDFLGQLTYSGIGLKDNDSCLMGHMYAFVNELGDVYYCNNIREEFLMGNLKKQSFKDIWFSNKYQQLRQKIYQGDFLPVCRECLEERGNNFKTRFFVSSILAKQVLNDVLGKIDKILLK